MINFPVITNLSIDNYELYPGKDGNGLSHSFMPGVTVIAGVNGLGKTTLLNVLFRLLVGPSDWRANNTANGIGNIRHMLTGWKNKKYFAERVMDEAHNSRVSATIKFGKDKIEIVRKLKDLSIVEFSHNDVPQSTDHNHYQNIVCGISNVGSFFDFYFVLKYLVFFLEDRTSSIWDKKAMDGILRILFYPRGEAKKFAELRDNIQIVDSDRRNFQAHASKLSKELLEALKKEGQGDSFGKELGSLSIQINAHLERKKELEGSIAQADVHRNEARQKHARAKLDLEEKQRNHQELQENYFSNLFPSIENIANYVLVNLDSGSGCLVCGSREIGLVEHIHRKIEDGKCPVCDTSSEHHENVIPTQKIEAVRLDKVALEIEHKRETLKGLNEEISRISSDYDALLKEQLDVNQQLRSAQEKEALMQSKMPTSSDKIERLKRQVKDNTETLNERLSNQRQLETESKAMLKIGFEKVKGIANEIETNFNNYIQSFLAEKCELRFQPMMDKVANDAERIEFPRFTIRMTSNTSPKSPQPRSDRNSVSESQAEFIDLAFRMALIKTVSTHSAAMMILETPEASLDSIFIGKAGMLLNGFADDGKGSGNRLIVSTNLNKEDMIPALFGVPPEDEVKRWHESSPSSPFPMARSVIPRDERERRVINLIIEARESASIQQYRADYEYRYKEEVFPSWEALLSSFNEGHENE
ncbi:hypothetical protein D8Y20_08560 [Mariprofundus sp. EBB-1]|uniref:AAA family ATPase n=1 Tax=Mariprofundus sp. EBB-1 TaxID=2650971 RepID=UPI000EF206F9|nr:AAA family ATPase [Mariprofundus sp. EBB-1]RLL51729.1 hypothetical protein D8Y20_08560 [Mariprofundus sp. EBB-1]